MNNQYSIISVLDTSICSLNVGDEIIMDAVNREINQMFSDSRINIWKQQFVDN